MVLALIGLWFGLAAAVPLRENTGHATVVDDNEVTDPG